MKFNQQAPLIVITGPTASGKTGLAIELAKELDGEIICADSRTVYKGLDVGTAKPSAQEQQATKHWGLDLVAPNERFSVAQFKDYADRVIADIRSRGKTPLLVGGTGLYIDAIIFDYKFSIAAKQEEWAGDLNDELIASISDNKAQQVILTTNRNEQFVQRRSAPISTSFIVGIATDKRVLRNRINQRLGDMLQAGVVQEAEQQAELYGWSSAALSGNIYQLIRRYRAGEMSIHQLVDKGAILDWRLAKRQLTWLRRNPYIVWSDLPSARKVVLQAVGE